MSIPSFNPTPAPSAAEVAAAVREGAAAAKADALRASQADDARQARAAEVHDEYLRHYASRNRIVGRKR